MIIGIPRELKPGETRVSVTPEGAKKLTEAGHGVIVQTAAGALSGYDDEAYRASGAIVTESLAEVWEKSGILIKVKEPDPLEFSFFRQEQTVFSFLHPAAHLELTKAMLASGGTFLSYDLVMLDDGSLPILEPMSVIAGKLAIQNAAIALQAGGNGGAGVLLGGTEKVPAAKVVVVGGGNAGKHAALVARGMGAETVILDIDTEKLSRFSKNNPSIKVKHSTSESLLEEISNCSILVGAVLIPGASAPKIISREGLRAMPRGSVLVDISIDQGGFSETSRATTISEPTYVEEGVVHSCIANMPALVPQTSTRALTAETLAWIEKLAEINIGNGDTLADHPALKRSLVCQDGKLFNKAVADSLGLPTG